MYGVQTTVLGSTLAATGLAVGSHTLAAVGMIFAGVTLVALCRKSNPIKP